VSVRIERTRTPLNTVKQLLSVQFVLVVAFVTLVVAPLGIAITGRFGTRWVVCGAVIWTTLFGYAAARAGRSPIGWGLAGGLICSTVWAQAELVGDKLIYLGLGTWTSLVVLSIGAGIGGGALVGAALGEGPSREAQRYLRSAALLMGSGLGVASGLVAIMGSDASSMTVKALFVGGGALIGIATALPGRSLGLWFRPSVLFFEELWPYLREMATPMAAFGVGFFCLTVTFAGFYGALWHADRTAFDGFRASPEFWDFVYFSLMTASTANTDVSARSQSAQAVVSIEVVLGLGWMIVVFGALSAHLAPRLERLARAPHRVPDEPE
jgi:hypothetical protein